MISVQNFNIQEKNITRGINVRTNHLFDQETTNNNKADMVRKDFLKGKVIRMYYEYRFTRQIVNNKEKDHVS